MNFGQKSTSFFAFYFSSSLIFFSPRQNCHGKRPITFFLFSISVYHHPLKIFDAVHRMENLLNISSEKPKIEKFISAEDTDFDIQRELKYWLKRKTIEP